MNKIDASNYDLKPWPCWNVEGYFDSFLQDMIRDYERHPDDKDIKYFWHGFANCAGPGFMNAWKDLYYGEGAEL